VTRLPGAKGYTLPFSVGVFGANWQALDVPRKYPDIFCVRAFTLMRLRQPVTMTAGNLEVTDEYLYGRSSRIGTTALRSEESGMILVELTRFA